MTYIGVLDDEGDHNVLGRKCGNEVSALLESCIKDESFLIKTPFSINRPRVIEAQMT